jgi:hypothetical protein
MEFRVVSLVIAAGALSLFLASCGSSGATTVTQEAAAKLEKVEEETEEAEAEAAQAKLAAAKAKAEKAKR